MTYTVMMTKQAKEDIRGIFEYIAFELHAIKAAIEVLEKIEQRISSLDTMPERYRVYGKEPLKTRKIRVIPVDNYCIFYIVRVEKVVVLRVMYGRRDLENQLRRHNLYDEKEK